MNFPFNETLQLHSYKPESEQPDSQDPRRNAALRALHKPAALVLCSWFNFSVPEEGEFCTSDKTF